MAGPRSNTGILPSQVWGELEAACDLMNKTCHSCSVFLSQDILEYRKKLRPLRVRTLDMTVKTILVDDSQTVAELTKAICARIGETCVLNV